MSSKDPEEFTEDFRFISIVGLGQVLESTNESWLEWREISKQELTPI